MHQSNDSHQATGMWPELKWISLAALLVLVALVYRPGLSGSFLFDDTHNIVENPAVQMTSPGWQAISEAATAYGSRLPHRPVATISLAIDYWLWDGQAYGFKLTNLLLHLLTTVLLLLLARQLLHLTASSDRERGAAFWPALAVAAVWAVHPLQVSTVLYVVQRMEMLAAFFIILSLLAYIAARVRLQAGSTGGWAWMSAAGVFTLLAVFSKETGALAPFFMLALELLVFRFATARPTAARWLKIGFGLFVAAAVLLYLFWLLPRGLSGQAYIQRDFTWTERLLTQLRVLPMYLGWILLPATDHYLFYYDHYDRSISLFQPLTTLFGGLLLAGLLVAAFVLRKRAPLVALGILWFFIAHALTSNVIALELVFEHRNYLALFAILLAVAGGLHPLASKLSPDSGWLLARTVPLVLLAGLSVLTLIRAATWGDEMNLALHHAEINPQSERASLDLVEIYLREAGDHAGSPFMPMAHARLERAATVPKSRTTADAAIITLAARSDAEIPHEAWQRLLAKVENRALGTSDYDALYGLIQERYQGTDIDDVRLWQLHQAMCRRDDLPAVLHVRFGYYAALVLDDLARASSAFRRALELISDDTEEQQALLKALSGTGIELQPGIQACAEQAMLSYSNSHQG